MSEMTEEKIVEIRALIALESPSDAVLVPVSDLRGLLDTAGEALHMRRVFDRLRADA